MKLQIKKRNAMFMWFFEIICVSLLPYVLAIIFQKISSSPSNFLDLICNGEMILTSAIIVITATYHGYLYKKNPIKISQNLLFCICLVLSIIFIAVFAYIKSGISTHKPTVLILSAICPIAAVIASFTVEWLILEGYYDLI